MRRASILAIGLLMGACGGDNNVAQPNNAANNTNAASNNATTNNGATNAATNNGATNNASTNSSTTNNTATNNTSTNNLPGCEPLEPPIGDCDPLCQTGCEVGEHCLVDAQGMAACGPAGPRVQNDECSADTECAVGLHCRSVGTAPSTCLNYCNRNGEPRCPSGHACVRLQADERIGACVPIENTCDAVPTDSCADPDECYDTVQGRQCLPSGDGAVDEACALSTDCAPGLRCVTVLAGDQVCKSLCDPNGAADQCVAPAMCRSLQSPDGAPLSWGACF